MKDEHRLALIVAFYLSKFDSQAYTHLSFESSTRAHQYIGERLSVKASTIQNMRDEFDPYHDNPRKGWYQREISPSRKEVMDNYGSYSESELLKLVQSILNPSPYEEIEIFNIIEKEEISESDKKALEGELIEKKVLAYKRNRSNIRKCKERDQFRCLSCSFSYDEQVVECHHLKPLHMVKESLVGLDDLITLCPTCHRLAHILLKRDYAGNSNKTTLLRNLNLLLDSTRRIITV